MSPSEHPAQGQIDLHALRQNHLGKRVGGIETEVTRQRGAGQAQDVLQSKFHQILTIAGIDRLSHELTENRQFVEFEARC